MIWKKKPKSIVTPEDEEWIIEAYDWFEQTFDVDLATQEVYLPTKQFLGFPFQGEEEDALRIVDIVAEKLRLQETSQIDLYFYDEFQQMEFTDEGVMSKYEEGSKLTNGLYTQSINDENLFFIGIERSLLKNPVNLIRTIAHELCHIKLLGEGRLEENDEPLTDLTASLFGFVVFLANGSISSMKTWSGNTHSGWQINGTSGYLHYKIYSFLIAYWITKRKSEPDFLEFLHKDLQVEVKRATKYLQH